tara:strand:- start:74573 stop:75145 length:573 start_codon:yes stop_codon:yes gene_type:complete
MKQHELMTPDDPHDCPHGADPTEAAVQDVTCWLCDGGLAACRICAAVGADLDAPCPGPPPPPPILMFEPLDVPVVDMEMLDPGALKCPVPGDSILEDPAAGDITAPAAPASTEGELVSPGLLVSCALRLNKNFANLEKDGQESVLKRVRAVFEEVMGYGHYRPEREAEYATLLQPGLYRPKPGGAARSVK